MTIRYAVRDSHLHNRFTKGDCDILAMTISERTGWPVLYFEGYHGGHAVVQLPDGRYLDVFGTMTRRELDRIWDFPAPAAPWLPADADWRMHDDPELYLTAEELIALVMIEPEETITGSWHECHREWKYT